LTCFKISFHNLLLLLSSLQTLTFSLILHLLLLLLLQPALQPLVSFGLL
jgi:hypothetical protein